MWGGNPNAYACKWESTDNVCTDWRGDSGPVVLEPHIVHVDEIPIINNLFDWVQSPFESSTAAGPLTTGGLCLSAWWSASKS